MLGSNKRKLERITRLSKLNQEKGQRKVYDGQEQVDENNEQTKGEVQSDDEETEAQSDSQSQSNNNEGTSDKKSGLFSSKKQNKQNQENELEEQEDLEDLQFEEDIDDEYEEEEVIDNHDPAEENQDDWKSIISEEENQQNQLRDIPAIQNTNMISRGVKFEEKDPKKPFMGNNQMLGKDEILDYDNRAYHMLHRSTTEWPCLSCDIIIPPEVGFNPANPTLTAMKQYPFTIYVAAGTQTQKNNSIYLMKWSKLHKTKYDDDSDDNNSEEEDDEAIDNDEDPELNLQNIKVKAGVNRLRCLNNGPVAAFWSDNGEFSFIDLRSKFQLLHNHAGEAQPPQDLVKEVPQIQSFTNKVEGFALDFNPIKMGVCASGSCDGLIYLYEPKADTFEWVRNNDPYTYHQGSVEDIQWSPVQDFAFASCSTDGTIQMIDTRVGNKKRSQLLIKAHACDVNVINWNRKNPYLMASGADDGCFKVWDIRYPNEDSLSEIKWHTEAITSIAFQPGEESVLAVSSADNRLSIWDFSVENDKEGEENLEVPDQMMFLHQGQNDIKEIKYHPHYFEMIISTAGDGFNVFKPTLDQDSVPDLENERPEDIPMIRQSQLAQYFESLNLNQ